MIMNTVIDVLFVAWGVIAGLSTLSAWRYTWGLPLTEIPGTMPPAVVIVAVKNASDVSRAFFSRLRHQAYPDYRIIAAVESAEDPAFAMVRRCRLRLCCMRAALARATCPPSATLRQRSIALMTFLYGAHRDTRQLH
jgi:hypothetical protein